MRFLTQWLLVLLTVLNPILVNAALTDFDRQEIAFKNWLAPYNSGFESGKAKWTASGGTFLAVTSGSNLLDGKGSFTWDASASGQTLTSQAITVPNGGFGLDCEVEILAQVPSGTATHYVRAFDGTNPIAYQSIISSTTPRWNAVTFPCPSSGTVALQFYANADEPLIAGDLGYVGRSKRVGSTQLISEWASFTPTGTWSSNTTYTGQWRRVGDSLEMRAKLALSGAPTSATLSVNLPSAANCTIDTNKIPTTVADYVPILGEGIARDNATAYYNINVVYNNTTSVLPITKKVSGSYISQEAITQAAPFTFGNTDAIEFSARVPCVGWTASTVVMPNAQGWYVDATIAGANPSLGTSNVSSYTEITNGSLTMTPRTGSAAAGIMCSSTNAAATPTTSTSTCSAGSESLGLNAVIPVSGAYEVCADFSHYMEADQAEGINTAFQIVQTPTNAQTITTEGGSRKSGRNAPLAVATGTAQAINVPYTVCGIFQLSAGTNGFRLMYEQLVTGTPNGSEVLADELSTVGQRNLRFTIKPVNSQQQAILANSVSTSATNGLKTESFSFTCSGSSSIGVQLGGTSWVSSVGNIAAGACAVGISAGTFSGSPQCQATWTGGGSNAVVYTYAETSSGFNVGAVTDTGAAASSFTGKAMCVGPR